MTIQETITDIFREWLGTSEAIDYLKACASNILPKLHTAPGCQEVHEQAGRDERSADTEELAHEILAFILESFLPGISSNPEMMNLLVQHQFQVLISRAAVRFLNERRDRERSRDINPVKYIYRRYRELLSQSPDFQTGSLAASGTWYMLKTSKIQDARAPVSSDPLKAHLPMPHEYAAWPFPDHLFDSNSPIERQLFKKASLLGIARFFWIQAQQHTMLKRLPIQELVNYTASHFPWLNSPEVVSLFRQHRGADSGQEEYEIDIAACSRDPVSNTEDIAALAMSIQSISVMARDFVLSCPAEECAVFVLKTSEPPMTLKKIAETLNMKDANRVNTLYRSFSRRLARHVTGWPGPGLHELPPQAEELFMQELIRLCKNRRP